MASGEATLVAENTEVHVSKVKIAGLERTKTDMVVEQVRPVLQASTLKDLLVHSLESMERLEGLDIFKTVRVRLDATPPSDGGGVSERGVIVTFLVREYGRLSSTLAANAGTQSGDASIQMMLRNLFGRAEQLKVATSTTFPNWGQTLQLIFTKPWYKDTHKKLRLSVGTTDTKQPISGYQEYVTGSSLECHAPSGLGQHSLAWAVDWRQVFGFSPGVPMCVREQAGHSLKSSIKHTLEVDERDDPSLPCNGYRVLTTQEVAGFGGDVLFGRAELQSQLFQELWKDWVLSLSLWGGVLRAYSPSRINDRFLLGGPTTLRGFSMWGAGPRVKGFSVGGEAYWAAGFHLFAPLPLVKNELMRRIRLHSFLTTGNLIRYSSFSDLRTLVRDVRCSCGAGLQFRLGVAQIELNYALPLKASSTDGLIPGLQFGIGLEML